ncbi:hypothetical protein [Corallococcus sp. CA054B]|uniref:hypothetical protein n=1 Tax=Corallococcus sp. CA054B TaxID=2316734 RepID=UPI001F45FF3D|nr:hypothetical protein [Corallococcus sp. CA054B]
MEVSFARGNGGQYAFVAPSLGVTAAFTGSHYNDAGSALPLVLFGQYVLPAALGLERPEGRGGGCAARGRVVLQTVEDLDASGFRRGGALLG